MIKLAQLIVLLQILCACSNKENFKMKITFIRDDLRTISPTPEAADLMINYFILDNTIQTLFKYSSELGIKPNAVSEWRSSDNDLKWVFYLNADLHDNKGRKLTPSYWISGIEQVVKKINGKDKMILLSGLKGWQDYINSKGPFPVVANDQDKSLTFIFNQKPTGILEYLTMPILGFWNIEGEVTTWTGKYNIVSSEPNKVILEDKSGIQVQVRTTTFDKVDHVEEDEIALPSKPLDFKFKGTIIKSTPTGVNFIELNTLPGSILSDNKLRNFLAQKISDYIERNPNTSPDSTPSKSLFFDVQDGIKYPSTEPLAKKASSLRVLISGVSPTQGNNFVNRILEETIKPYTEKLDIQYTDGTPESWKTVHDRKYDIRISSVHSGTSPDHWVTEMMFCTKQGISFIDPNNKICNFLKTNKNASKQELGYFINETVSESASHIILNNISSLSYIGESIDSNSVSSTSILPDLQRIKAK